MEGGKKKNTKNLLRHHFRLAGPTNVQRWRKTHVPAAPTSPKRASASEVPPPRAPSEARAPETSPPAGAAPGFRPEARRSLFGSGSSPALTREPSRNLNIRDLRPPAARISGDRKDPVTPLPFSPAAQAPALGAAAPSGAECLAARGGGARLSEPSRENAAPVLLCPALGKGETRGSALPSSRAGGTLQHFELVAACMC